MNEPSDEILGPLRNDGLGLHHLAEAVKELDELEVKVAELKAMVANGPPLECLAEQGGA